MKKPLCVYPAECEYCSEKRRCNKHGVSCGFRTFFNYALWGYLLLTEKLYKITQKGDLKK